MSSLVRVALAVPLYQCFDYLIDDNQRAKIQTGVRVKVPFGRRLVTGIMVEVDSQSELADSKLKSVVEIIDQQPILPDYLFQLLHWAANYYQYPLGEVLFHALPIPLRQGKSATAEAITQWQLTTLGQHTAPETLKRAPKQQQLLHKLQTQQPLAELQQQFAATIFQQLQKRGLLEKVSQIATFTDWRADYAQRSPNLQLNPEQQQAIDAIKQHQNQFVIWLLEGVTGSGKTEVYLHHLNAVLAQGKQALILVPEIGLTPQTINRFAERFQAPIDILHSGLTDKQRLKVWQRAKMGQNAIVIGTRSALFTPFQNLGTIVIDEEHDNSYKQQEGWRYHARDLAIVRAKLQQIPIILGSATPAMETLYNAQRGKYQHLKLTRRAGQATPATQHILDIKGLPLTAGLAQPMIARIRHHLQHNNQVMLFLNRRGFAPRIICHDCGWLAECPRCDRPYTYHQQQQRLICHHCDSMRPVPKQCPHCGSTHLIPLGIGTEQLEQQLSQLFPGIPVSRIDRDSTSKKGALEHYLQAIGQGGAHILVGTQILAKGHHFPDVTMVGILDVDGALFANDFRATERFAQLYTQVSGRAGRANKAGEVFLQTYHPEHPLLQTLLQQGYTAFATQTLAERQATCLPPYSHQVLIRAADKNNQSALQFLYKVAQWISHLPQDSQLWMLGPNPAFQAKKAGNYRYQLLLQHPKRQQLQALIQLLLQQVASWPESSRCRWSLDIDPQEI